MSAPFDASIYETDKCEAFMARYERVCAPWRDRPVQLFELGVKTGGCLRMWADFFPLGEIVGLDLNPVAINHPRIHVYRGFQQDVEVLDHIANKHAPRGFDMIIDDASHLGEYTAASFSALYYRHLAPGGIYVLEDWDSGYWPDWPDGRAVTPATALGKPRLDDIRRKLRSASRGVAQHLRHYRRTYSVLERVYVGVERRAAIVDFPSHSAGMVGFVKQLIDLTAVTETRLNEGGQPTIAEMWICQGQVFCFKAR